MEIYFRGGAFSRPPLGIAERLTAAAAAWASPGAGAALAAALEAAASRSTRARCASRCAPLCPALPLLCTPVGKFIISERAGGV
jgi:hypothetical protein